jgi:dihydrofolate reductase
MKAIVAVDLDWGIGYKGNLLQPIPEDLKLFKQLTLGKVVIMGRETFESLPGKEPLKDRINIVLSRDEKFVNNNITICRSLEELYKLLANYSTDDVFVIGGESIYTQLLPFCSEAYVTIINKRYIADKYFANINELETWEAVSTGNPQSYNEIEFCFNKYVNNRYINNKTK